MVNLIKSSNFAEYFLVVEDLASISIRVGQLLTLTQFSITRTSNLCVINQFWRLFRYFLLFSLYSVWIKLVTMSEFLISLFSEVITVTHDHLRMTHPNDAPVSLISFFHSARFIIPAQKVLKRNIARYLVIIISLLGVISYLSVVLRS